MRQHRHTDAGARRALGAGRGRILRQMLVESLLLATIGGLSGLAFAYAARGAVAPYTPHIDWQVFGSTDAITILTGLLFGLAPSRIVEAFWRRRERCDGLPAFVDERRGGPRSGAPTD